MSIETPVIVVVAFNRLNSLERLLNSLNNGIYENEIKLIISIDKGNNKDIFEYAKNFEWKYGEKEVIYQKENLGLKKHILKCGDLTKEYGSIILLEDDLFVSPYFYDYAIQALKYYKNDDDISQISLYKHSVNNNTGLKFSPINDSSDIFFMQFASSWGQIWTYNQWKNFREWFDKNDLSISQEDNLPDFVIKWKETSWLKYFLKYNVENNKYVVYPRISLTSNFSDVGTNNPLDEIFLYQKNLLLEKKEYLFKKLNNSLCIYDVYFEIDKSITNKFIKEYNDIEFDLYGTKKLKKIKTKYLISVKNCKSPLKTFAMSLKPHETNILMNLKGDSIKLSYTKDFTSTINSKIIKSRFKYYWTHTVDYNNIIYLLLHRTKHKFINLLKKIKNVFKR